MWEFFWRLGVSGFLVGRGSLSVYTASIKPTALKVRGFSVGWGCFSGGFLDWGLTSRRKNYHFSASLSNWELGVQGFLVIMGFLSVRL